MFNLSGKSSSQRAAHEKWKLERDKDFRELFPVDSDRLTLQAVDDALDAIVRLFHKRTLRYGRS